MKKVVLLTVAVLLVASVGFATDTRVTTMGGVGDFLIDDANIYTYPAWVSYYTGNVIAELGYSYYYKDNGNYSDDYVGAFFQTAYGNWGFIVGRSTIPMLVEYASDLYYYKWSYPEYVYWFTPKLEVIYGTNFGEMDFGIGIEWAGDTYTEDYEDDVEGDTYDEKQSVSAMGATASLIYPLGEDSWVDFGVHFHKYSWKYEMNGYKTFEDTYSDDGSMYYGINLRAFIPMGHYSLVPMLHFTMGNADWKYEYDSSVDADYDTSFSGETSTTSLTAGLGWNWPIFEGKGLCVFGILAGMYSEKYDEDYIYYKNGGYVDEYWKYTLPGFVFGGEAQILPWLSGRIGFYKYLYNKKVKYTYEEDGDKGDVTDEYSWFDSPFGTTFGLAIMFGNWTFDLHVNEDFFFNGPYFWTGAPTSSPASQVSATWNFGG